MPVQPIDVINWDQVVPEGRVTALSWVSPSSHAAALKSANRERLQSMSVMFRFAQAGLSIASFSVRL